MRALLISLLWGIACVYTAIIGSASAYFFASSLGMVVAVYASSYFQRKPVISVARETSYPSGLHGEDMEVETVVTFRSRRIWNWVWIEERWSCPLDEDSWVVRKLVVPFGKKEIRYTYRLPELERGKYESSEVTVISGEGLGIRRNTYRLSNQLHFYMYPIPLFDPVHRLRASNRLEQYRWMGRWDDVQEWRQLRDYQPGDEMRHIHWKQFAKRGQLKVIERERYREQKIGLWLHSWVDTSTRNSHLEWAIQFFLQEMKHLQQQGATIYIGLSSKGTGEVLVYQVVDSTKAFETLSCYPRLNTAEKVRSSYLHKPEKWKIFSISEKGVYDLPILTERSRNQQVDIIRLPFSQGEKGKRRGVDVGAS